MFLSAANRDTAPHEWTGLVSKEGRLTGLSIQLALGGVCQPPVFPQNHNFLMMHALPTVTKHNGGFVTKW